MLYVVRRGSPLGMLSLSSDGENITGLWPVGHKYFEATVRGDTKRDVEVPVFALATRWLDAYFAGERPAVSDVPLAPGGGAFRQAVWNLVSAIPYGQCATYGEIAKKLAALMHKTTMSSRAVGGAVGHNPVSVIIPCHRVVGADGSLTGYGGGMARKAALLELEGVDLSAFSIPARGTAIQGNLKE